MGLNRWTRLAALTAGALALASCGDTKTPRKKLQAADCPPPERPSLTLADQAPRVLPVADGADPLQAPFPVSGEDSGDPSLVYGTMLMGYYLIGVQRSPDCRDELKPELPCTPFAYEYDPRTATNTDHESLARQVVATLTQTWMYRVTGRDEFRASADAALDMLTPRVKRVPRVERFGRIRGGSRIENMGVTSLLAMSMAHYQSLTGDRSRAELLDELGQWLLDRVRANGAVPQGSALKKMQLHNALWRLYEATGDVRYLDALEAMAKWDLEHRGDTEKGDLFEHPYLYGLWVHEPLTELYQVRPQPWIAELLFGVADEVIKKQYTLDNAPECSHVGGFRPSSGRGHPNWNHTLKLEAVADAWRMAAAVGDEDRAAIYKERTLMAADFLLRFQHRKGELEGWAGGETAVGGVPLFIYDPRIRVDVPGHGGVAMSKVVEYLSTDTVPGAKGKPAVATPAPAGDDGTDSSPPSEDAPEATAP